MRKSFTLVEVLVSTMVLSICFASILSCYLLVNRQTEREAEYLEAEVICKDIALYGDDYGKNWDFVYYGSHNDSSYIYYDSSFNILPDINGAKYQLYYYYNSSNELIISIRVLGENRYIIKELNYGGGRYV